MPYYSNKATPPSVLLLESMGTISIQSTTPAFSPHSYYCLCNWGQVFWSLSLSWVTSFTGRCFSSEEVAGRLSLLSLTSLRMVWTLYDLSDVHLLKMYYFSPLLDTLLFQCGCFSLSIPAFHVLLVFRAACWEHCTSWSSTTSIQKLYYSCNAFPVLNFYYFKYFCIQYFSFFPVFFFMFVSVAYILISLFLLKFFCIYLKI